MKNKLQLNKLFYNDKILLAISFLVALIVWVYVVVNVSPETTRTIKDVKVTVDTSVPSQFGLEVFGESEFYVDVTVKGKKYLISSESLVDDIIVTAQTNNVDSAGTRTLQLKGESSSGNDDYVIESLSAKTVDVYFDTAKTIQMPIEPLVVADDFPIVSEGYTCGIVNLSEGVVTITGPSTEINRIEKVVAKLVLDASLTSNKSADAKVQPVDDAGKSNFEYLTMNLDSVVLTIPVLQVKELLTSVTFKNAPTAYVTTPLKFTVSPEKDFFNISVDEYEQTVVYPVGVIDFKNLSPSNHVFTFSSDNTNKAEDSSTTEYKVNVDMTGITQEYITVPYERIHANNPGNASYKISGLNKSVVIVGPSGSLEAITAENINVEVDLSEVNISKGQTTTVPAVVTVQSENCWVYGTYTVEISL